jgi:predicted DNA-binding protein YlxM (UPF0122 family)
MRVAQVNVSIDTGDMFLDYDEQLFILSENGTLDEINESIKNRYKDKEYAVKKITMLSGIGIVNCKK